MRNKRRAERNKHRAEREAARPPNVWDVIREDTRPFASRHEHHGTVNTGNAGELILRNTDGFVIAIIAPHQWRAARRLTVDEHGRPLTEETP